MKVLITGAKGFIGKNLVTALNSLKQGYDKTHPEINISEIYCYDKDSEKNQLHEYCKNADFVLNFAGVNRPKYESEFKEGNVELFSELLEILKKYNNKCPVMLASSIQAEFDNPYGKSKKTAEEILFSYAKENSVKVLIYRFPNVFGKWCRPDYNSVVATFCYNIANGLPVTVSCDQTELTLVYIDDLVQEMLNALKGKENRTGEFCEVPVTFKRKLGFIADTIKSFKEMKSDFFIPDFSDSFVFRLYSTYLSYLPKEDFLNDMKTNADERGSFTELVKSKNSGQFSVNILKPGVVKGNHWHNSKSEKFIVINGHGLIQMRKIGCDENGNKFPVLEFEVSDKKFQSVDMIPGYTHNIINLSETEDLTALIWANECFDPDKPDIFHEKV